MTDADWQRLDPRFVPQQRVVGRLVAFVIALGTLLGLSIVMLAADDLATAGRLGLGVLWLVAMAGQAVAFEVWPSREFAHTRYRLDGDGLQIARGVWWRSVTHVPRSRVQHTDVSQGPLERRYGLGTLVVFTAGTDHARLTLPGLAHDTALALRDAIRTDRPDDVV